MRTKRFIEFHLVNYEFIVAREYLAFDNIHYYLLIPDRIQLS